LSEVLDQSLDLAVRTKAFARFVVPFLSDLAALVLVDDRGHIRQTDLAWVDDGRPSDPRNAPLDCILTSPYAQVIQQVLVDGRAATVARLDFQEPVLAVRRRRSPEAQALEIGFLTNALAAFPLRARGRTQGVMLLGFRAQRRFDASQFSFCNDVASRAAVLLDNALLYEKVREADARKNEFLAMLGHELRNPMAPIRYAVHMLRKPDLDEPKRAWSLDVIDRQVGQLSRLVDDLLDVSRITRGKIELKLESVDLERVVSTAVETCQPLIESLKHQLEIRLAPEPLWVHGDFARLTQVIANLLNNAAKYTEPGGRIALELDRHGAEAHVRVRDSGIGILPENMDKIFELFAQVDRKVDRAQGGLGIGLTLVQRLIRLHGGSVEVFSAGPGCGAEFLVRLPGLARAPADDQTEESARGKPPAASARVLVVDDNIDSAQTMSTSLQLEGFEADVAYDGETAIGRAVAFRPDVVLLDIGLPGMSGLDVAHTLRVLPATKDALLIALSGYGQAEDRQRSRDAGLDHHLTKPVDPGTLHALFTSLRAARDRS
jgi:signal transduction histidine kinase/CheY-like chemotaxis protein